MNLTPEQRTQFALSYLGKRQRARTDLFWLANDVLSPSDSKIMTRKTHGVIVDHCQKFFGYKEVMSRDLKIIAAEQLCKLEDLPGERDRLLLASRGHLKTTIHVVAQVIQFLLNYQNARLLICTSTDEKAQLVVEKIKQHFQFNRKLRFLFPEFCPGTTGKSKSVSEFGSRSEFRLPNCTHKNEPSVMSASVGKALASTHHDGIFCTDVVTENNVKTQGSLQEVSDFFGYLEPLRERFESKEGHPNPAPLFIEGTIYDFGDYHSKMVDVIRVNPDCGVKLTKQSCWIDKDKGISWWPERFPAEELYRIRRSPAVGPVLFASQYELDPVPPGDGLARREDIRFFPQKYVKELMPRYSVQTTVDLNGMDPNNTDSDFAVFTTSGFDHDGRMDVLNIVRGRYSDDQIIELFFLIQQTFPKNLRFKMQKDHLTVGLQAGLRREMEKRRRYLTIEAKTISTTETKKYRIKKSLQGWFKMGLIRFSDSIGSHEKPTELSTALVNEILRFPKGEHDDILDTLADQFVDRDGEMVGDVLPTEDSEVMRRGNPPNGPPVLGFNPYQEPYIETDMAMYYDAVTGV